MQMNGTKRHKVL